MEIITHKHSGAKCVLMLAASREQEGKIHVEVDHRFLMRMELESSRKKVCMIVAIWDVGDPEARRTFPHGVQGLFHICFYLFLLFYWLKYPFFFPTPTALPPTHSNPSLPSSEELL